MASSEAPLKGAGTSVKTKGVAPQSGPPCRFGDSCFSKTCKFSHPGGALCSFALSCNPPRGKVCKFRHPAPSGGPLAAAADAQSMPPLVVPRQPATASGMQAMTRVSAPAGLRQNLRVVRVMEGHARIIKAEERELQRISDVISASVDIGSEDTATRGAIAAKIFELKRQREVFELVHDRAEARVDLSEPERQQLRKCELFRFQSRLPALAKRLEVEKHLPSSASRFTIVKGQTGSGKSTQITQYAVNLPCFTGKRILCTQPRKLAAISVATRVAFEHSAGWPKAQVGRAVGYRVGGQWRVKNSTRIEFITEGVLLDMIARAHRGESGAHGNSFDNVGCVIIDEAHERSIICDLLLGSLKEDHPKWHHVKVVIASATIDLDLFSRFYNGAPVVEIQGRMFPVDMQYMPSAGQGTENGHFPAIAQVSSVVARCALTIHQTFAVDEGDILRFLPEQEDVLHAKEHFELNLERLRAQNAGNSHLGLAKAHALYGRQDPEEQAEAFAKHTDRSTPRPRKVISSTDVAETSVTIDGAVYVIDIGLKKAMVYDPLRNMSSLKVYTICRSSAIQRTGRAGRTRPGKCFRLYSAQDLESMDVGNVAEIFRQPLCLVTLTLFDLGIGPQRFKWIEAPTADTTASATVELQYLGAIDQANRVTALG